MFRTVALRCGVFVLKCKYIFNSYFHQNNTQIDITSLTSLSVLTFAHTFLGLTRWGVQRGCKNLAVSSYRIHLPSSQASGQEHLLAAMFLLRNCPRLETEGCHNGCNGCNGQIQEIIARHVWKRE